MGDSISIRKKPVNVVPSEEILFLHEYKKVYPSPQTSILTNVRINHQGIIFKTFRIVMDSFRGRQNSKYQKTIHQLKFILKNRLLNQEKKILAGIWFTDTWSVGYFHWITDALTRLETVKEGCDCPVYLPYEYSKYEYITSTLKFFPGFDIQFLPFKSTYHFENLHLPLPTSYSTGNYNDQILQKLRLRFRTGYSSINNLSSRIYISREKATKRKVENEIEIIPILKKYHFEIKYLEDHDWTGQMSIFLPCQALISIHGAGLTNMLLMPSGSSLIELRRKGDDHNNCYFSMASALDVDYYYLLCEKKDVTQTDSDIKVDPHKLEQLLSDHFPI